MKLCFCPGFKKRQKPFFSNTSALKCKLMYLNIRNECEYDVIRETAKSQVKYTLLHIYVSLIYGIIISTDEDPSKRTESFAIINLCGVSTKLCFNLIFTIQTYKELI